MEMWYLLITEKLFWTFRVWEIQSFLRQKVKEKMIFTDYWNVLVLNFLGMENTIFFEAKSWWKDYIYWLLKSSCFELFRNGKYSLFWGKKLMERWYLLITEVLVLGYQKVPVLSFSLTGNTVFFYKKGNFYVVFLSFLILQDPGNMAFRAVINSIWSDELLHTEVSQLKIVGDLT